MKTAIHTPHKWQFKRVLEIFKDKGYRWFGSGILLAEEWIAFGKETCLFIKYESLIDFSHKNLCKKLGLKIISYDTFLLNESRLRHKEFLIREGKMFEKNLFEVGDVILNNYDSEFKVLGICGDVYFLGDSLGSFYGTYSKLDLKENNYHLKSDTTEVLGKKYKTEELKKRLKRLKEVN